MERIRPILDRVTLLPGDLTDSESLRRAVEISWPNEVYNLAAMSHVGLSFQQPLAAAEINGLGAARLLGAIQSLKLPCRFYQASTSEMFGNTTTTFQDEQTPFHPCSPYAIAKLAAHWSTINYRESYGMYACCGILFNHESPRRGLDFVTRKITRAAARIKLGLQKRLQLGNLQAFRDWGYAGDYVEAMWLMLQQETPGEYVIASGKKHSVQEFVDAAFKYLDLDYRDFLEVNPDLYRPTDVPSLRGNISKARHQLEWEPRISFDQLVAMMVENDLMNEYQATK